MHPDAIGMLYAWHSEAVVEGCIDRTVYGASRTATTSFFTHHLHLISLAAVIGAALRRRLSVPSERKPGKEEISPILPRLLACYQ